MTLHVDRSVRLPESEYFFWVGTIGTMIALLRFWSG